MSGISDPLPGNKSEHPECCRKDDRFLPCLYPMCECGYGPGYEDKSKDQKKTKS